MNTLRQKGCQPCEGGVAPLDIDQIKTYMAEFKTPWELENEKKIRRVFSFKNFKEAMVFVNKVADLAEAEGHHPDITIHYSKVTIELWTHAIRGLSENDFIVAAKIEAL